MPTEALDLSTYKGIRTMTIKTYNFPTKIMIGQGAASLIANQLMAHNIIRPLIVTDSGLAKLVMFENIIADLDDASLNPVVFSDFSGNPLESHVKAGVKAYHHHNCDGLVLVGGGAALDVGKAIALMATHPGELFDYENGKPDALPVCHPIPYMIAVPTTAGTGSEVGRSSVISDDKTHTKRIIFDPKLLPPQVIADPMLTVDLPPFITATTGIDALTHCVEAFLAPAIHPMCDGIALEGVRLVSQALVKAVHEGDDLEAREKMLNAAMMGSVAFQKGLGVTHSCAHAMSAVFNTHHGLANAIMFATCMRFNGEAVPEKMARLAEAVGLKDHSTHSFVHWYLDLCRQLDVALDFKTHGIEVTDQLLDLAFADGCHQSNPRPVSREDFKTIFEEAASC